MRRVRHPSTVPRQCHASPRPSTRPRQHRAHTITIASARRLDAYLDAMKRSGVLAKFNTAYRRRRMEAAMRGKGFMTYASVPAQPPPYQGNRQPDI
jgi:hypothetical protein